ncbi:ankyrin repeat and KH domain-containing protein 1-like isoform X1 [Panicum miliaceum]|uniref:Ankyrin repeat and KH domain-containing protein 1-like isoform X1 n=1 Tax=Panicum miliaceum TaxID=4540 RepID=A0A3L6T1N0_PANMI|nr:ankyrin repeat and KH domain-containing protein 1-like isoform X1 [Panicum miliaceum]
MPRHDTPLPHAFKLVLGKDQDKWPPEATLLVAAYYGDIRRLKEIAKSIDVKGKGLQETLANANFVGMYALHAVCESGNMYALQYLVEDLNMDVNKPDTMRGFTPAMHAVLYGNLLTLRFLFDHGANLHGQHKGLSLLHAAAEGGRPEIAKFLLSRGACADVEVEGEPASFTPLFIATYRGYASVLKMLLEQNADPNVCMNDQITPINMALKHSSVACLKLLVQSGADVNGFGSYNPLARAAEKGLTEDIKCLLEAGANPNVPDTFGRLPIELAAEYGTWEDVELLFPVTSKIPTVADWSVHGIISHVHMEVMQLEDHDFVKKKKSELKRQGADAFRNEDYLKASVFYTQALKVDQFDATLFSNRSICWLRLGDGKKALYDAMECKDLRPKWAKAYYRKGAALMFLKDYDSAYDTLSRGLELDPESEEMEELLWEAVELK